MVNASPRQSAAFRDMQKATPELPSLSALGPFNSTTAAVLPAGALATAHAGGGTAAITFPSIGPQLSLNGSVSACRAGLGLDLASRQSSLATRRYSGSSTDPMASIGLAWCRCAVGVGY